MLMLRWPFVRRDTFIRSEKEAQSWREIAQERGNKLIGAQVEADRHLAALNLSAASNARLRDQNVLLNARALRAEGLVEKAEAVALAEERRVNEVMQQLTTANERVAERGQEILSLRQRTANAEVDFAGANIRIDELKVAHLRESSARIAAETKLEASEKRIEGIDARYDTLLERYHALKLVGASLPEPPPERVPSREPDVVTQAMIARGRGSPVLMKQFAEYVTERRGEGVLDTMIAAEILAGVTDDEGIPA